jgi:hypothetical protein
MPGRTSQTAYSSRASCLFTPAICPRLTARDAVPVAEGGGVIFLHAVLPLFVLILSV